MLSAKGSMGSATNKHAVMSFIDELKRRNVIKVGIAYVIVAWVVLQIADVLFPILTLPDWAIRLVAGLLIVGFPLALFFAWAFELTPEGIKREREVDRSQSITRSTGHKLNFADYGSACHRGCVSDRGTTTCWTKRQIDWESLPWSTKWLTRFRIIPR